MRTLKYFISVVSLMLLHAQAAPALDKETVAQFTEPVTFTHSGLQVFFTDIFNSPIYAEHVLHSHFGHLLDFLHYGSQLENPYDFTMTVLEIFHTRLHDCLWIDARTFGHLLNKFPGYFEHLCQQPDALRLQQEIQKLLYTTFTKKYTDYTKNQKSFSSFDQFMESCQELIDPLSHDLTQLAEKQIYERPLRALQDTIARFVESGIQKIIWDPMYPQDSWNSLHALAQQITDMQYAGLIYSPKLANHLYWALLYRYGYFLKAMKSQLGQKFFDTIKNDLVRTDYAWLNVPEQEEFLLAKASYLKHIIWECSFDLKTA